MEDLENFFEFNIQGSVCKSYTQMNVFAEYRNRIQNLIKLIIALFWQQSKNNVRRVEYEIKKLNYETKGLEKTFYFLLCFLYRLH